MHIFAATVNIVLSDGFPLSDWQLRASVLTFWYKQLDLSEFELKCKHFY